MICGFWEFKIDFSPFWKFKNMSILVSLHTIILLERKKKNL